MLKIKHIILVLIFAYLANTTLANAVSVKGEFYGAKLGTVIDALAKLSHISVIWDEEAVGKKSNPVYLSVAQPTPVTKLFKFVLEENNLIALRKGNIYVIKPAADAIFYVEPSGIRYLGKSAFYNLLNIIRRNVSPVAEIKVYPETDTIYVKDAKENIEYLKKIIEKYNENVKKEAEYIKEELAERKKLEGLLAKKIVYLTPDQFQEIEDELVSVLTPNGKYTYDPNTGRLMIIDEKDNILKIAKIIAKAQKVEVRSKCFYVKGVEPGELLLIIKQNYLSKYGSAFYKSKEIQTSISNSEGKSEDKTKGTRVTSNEIITSLPKICITDKPDVIERIQKGFANILLNRPYQIAIEARIVQISSNFKRELGVNWGVTRTNFGINGTYNFNIQGGVNAGGGALTFDFQPDTVAIPTGYGTLLNIGILGKKASLDLKLAALESVGASKILSRPKIVTLDGEEAEISQGIEIPYSTVASTSGATMQTIRFKKAELKLKVRPRTTTDGHIIMEIELQQDTPDFGNAIAGQPPINTKKVKSKVIVKDGMTIVIGGVLEKSEANNESGVPILRSIPLLGWLFRYKYKDISKKELLIFLTPKIVYE
jgi:type IV pilus assembly protein PilQ